ncbi:MAG: O-antigen polymerase [Ramlibacter sp.]|nr:O-antigen polymerase [Ramlibacter sp.]
MNVARVRGAAVAACLVLPWLNPAAGGPSAVMQPWMISAVAALLLWILIAPEVRRDRLYPGVAIAGAVMVIGGAAPPVLLALAGLAVIATGAAIASASPAKPWVMRAVANAWVAAAMVSSLLAIAQYFGLSPQLAPWVNPTEPGEAFANLRQRNQFATLSSIGLAALLWKVQQGTAPVRSWALPAAVLLAVANAASASRTGALQVILIVALTRWWVRPTHRGVAAVCIAAIGAYVAAALLLPEILQQTTGVSAPNALRRLASSDGCASRAVLWGNVVDLIAQRPWAGWGWGELDYAHFATLYPGARFCDILDNAHNLPLHLAVELGIPLALLVCGGFVFWLVRQRPWRDADPARQLAWSVIAVILLHSLLEYPLWYGPFQMAFGLALGLLARRRAPEGKLIGTNTRHAIGALLAAALLFTAWDYHRISQLYTPADQRSALYRGASPARMGDSWLFRDQLAFAELSITPLTRNNAVAIHALAMELLHYSPEPRVVEAAIESAMLVGREDQALWLLARYRSAFPKEYEAWSAANGLRGVPAEKIRD